MEDIITPLQTVESLGHFSSHTFLFCSLMDCPLGHLCICLVSYSQTATSLHFHNDFTWLRWKCPLSAQLENKSVGCRSSCPSQPSQKWAKTLPMAKASPGYGVYITHTTTLRCTWILDALAIELALILVIHALCLCHLCNLKPHKCHSWPYFATVTLDQVCIGNVKLWCNCMYTWFEWLIVCLYPHALIFPAQNIYPLFT